MRIWRDEPSNRERGAAPLVMGWGVPASGPVRTRWEYCRLETNGVMVTRATGDGTDGLTGVSLADALTRMGIQEWELCAIQQSEAGPIYVFKRPVTEGAAS